MRTRCSDRFVYAKGPVVDFPKDDPLSVSKTQRSQKGDVDINRIIAKYRKTGLLPVPVGVVPYYGDFSKIGSYSEALAKLREADMAFASLPSNLRERFNNDPGQFLDFMFDEANKDEAIKLGLIKPAPAPAAPDAPVAPAA